MSQARAGGAAGLGGLAGDGRDPMMTGTGPARAGRPGAARARTGPRWEWSPAGLGAAAGPRLQRGLAVALGAFGLGAVQR